MASDSRSMVSIAARKRASGALTPTPTSKNNPSAQALLTYNKRKIYAHLLAVEEHIADLSTTNINDSHCVVKHSLLAVEHHLNEAVNHASRIDPALADDFREFKEEATRVLRLDRDLSVPPAEPVKLEEVVVLRNGFRQMIGDSTLTKPCKVCELDSNSPPPAQKTIEINPSAPVSEVPSEPRDAVVSPPPKQKRNTTAARRRLLNGTLLKGLR